MAEYRQRYLFIDLLRFAAAVFMIQGHVFDALVSPQIKAHPLFHMHDFFHGFVAPAFLFASGVAFGATTMRRWDEHVTWGKRPRRRVQRFLGLIAIGYALHLPFFSLRKTMTAASPAKIQSMLQSDVLQCIGLTLLLLQIAILLTREKKFFGWVVAVSAAVVIFSSPLTWSGHFSGYLPTALVAYLSPETGSWFPLFPWSGYILCGVLFGCTLANAANPVSAATLMRRYALLNVGILALAWAVMYLPFDLYPAHDFWKSNPSIFFVRLSAVGIVASLIFLSEGLWKTTPYYASIIGRQSLFIYILHLMVVYGSVLNRGLAQRIGPTLQVLPALGVFALVLTAVGLITILWYQWKSEHETAASRVTATAAAAFLLTFAMRPW